MNLWIDIARDDLVKVVERVDCVILNDAELRQLTGKPSLVAAADELLAMGPRRGHRQAGRVRRGGHHRRRRYFSLPAFPLETVIDPTGAGDTFAGGFVGAIAGGSDVRTAVAYGTAVASFNVEEFGTERVARLTRDEVDARVAELHALTTFELELA